MGAGTVKVLVFSRHANVTNTLLPSLNVLSVLLVSGVYNAIQMTLNVEQKLVAITGHAVDQTLRFQHACVILVITLLPVISATTRCIRW